MNLTNPKPEVEAMREKINEFCITFCTVNGSGSATANNIIFRALFKMGIPVSGKNIFPSNIQGLPTWYSLRVSREGYLGRVEKDDIIVAMNAATFKKDMDYLVPGGVIFYADDIKLPELREDIIAYPMPVKQIIKEAQVPANLKDYSANMVYVGILAQVLGIDFDAIYQTLDSHFKGKKTAIDANFGIIKAAGDWAAQNLNKRDAYRVEPMDATQGYIMTDGNAAGALGSIYGGMQFCAWYPITPATSLAESLNEYLPQLRKDSETGKETYAVVQSEDELAAIGMTIGAGYAGLRSMTSTSGPGLSLMSEYLGLAYFAEVPIVVWDVQRVGPSTGLPTRTAQGDITMVNFISHGDRQYVILFPGSVNECFEFGWKALDLAERIQSPVFVMSDLDLGMNQWITPAFQYPDRPIDRGKILWEEDLEKMLQERNGDWGRYLDIDGDGIPYRTVPGNTHPKSAYFARGTGHDEYSKYSEEPEVWERLMARIAKKFETIKKDLPKPEIKLNEGAQFGILAYGSSDFSVREAMDLLEKQGIKADYLRVRAIPFTEEVEQFVKAHDRTYVVELNRDGQMCQLLTLEYPDCALNFRKAAHLDGLALSATWIVNEILRQEENEQ